MPELRQPGCGEEEEAVLSPTGREAVISIFLGPILFQFPQGPHILWSCIPFLLCLHPT